MITREEFMEMLAYNLTDEDCRRLFSVSSDELKDGSAKWNMALEYDYNLYITELEYECENEM